MVNRVNGIVFELIPDGQNFQVFVENDPTYHKLINKRLENVYLRISDPNGSMKRVVKVVEKLYSLLNDNRRDIQILQELVSYIYGSHGVSVGKGIKDPETQEIMVCVSVFGDDYFGTGKNKEEARENAAKKALRNLINDY